MNVSIIPYQGKGTAMFIQIFFFNLNGLIYELVSSSFQPQLQNFSFQIKPINLRLILFHLVNKSLTCLKELKETVGLLSKIHILKRINLHIYKCTHAFIFHKDIDHRQ